jgi:hypothetical protein
LVYNSFGHRFGYNESRNVILWSGAAAFGAWGAPPCLGNVSPSLSQPMPPLFGDEIRLGFSNIASQVFLGYTHNQPYFKRWRSIKSPAQ